MSEPRAEKLEFIAAEIRDPSQADRKRWDVEGVRVIPAVESTR